VRPRRRGMEEGGVQGAVQNLSEPVRRRLHGDESRPQQASLRARRGGRLAPGQSAGAEAGDGGGAEAALHAEAGLGKKPEPLRYTPRVPGRPVRHLPMQGKAWLWETCVQPWKTLESQGVGVMVGEWGSFNKTPHDIVLRWAEDCLSNWQQAGWGWAMWNFRGAFGVLDSQREDVQYEDFEGHQLDPQTARSAASATRQIASASTARDNSLAPVLRGEGRGEGRNKCRQNTVIASSSVSPHAKGNRSSQRVIRSWIWMTCSTSGGTWSTPSVPSKAARGIFALSRSVLGIPFLELRLLVGFLSGPAPQGSGYNRSARVWESAGLGSTPGPCTAEHRADRCRASAASPVWLVSGSNRSWVAIARRPANVR